MPSNPYRHVRQFRGALTPSNSERLFESVIEDCNRIIGLQLTIDPTEETDALQILGNGATKLTLFQRDREAGTELNINGCWRWEHGSWLVDGFYLVKPGGTFQGTSCFGLLEADEAAIRLNSSIRIIPVQL